MILILKSGNPMLKFLQNHPYELILFVLAIILIVGLFKFKKKGKIAAIILILSIATISFINLERPLSRYNRYNIVNDLKKRIILQIKKIDFLETEPHIEKH